MALFSTTSSLTTRVGRRFLALFLISAFVPVSALSILTWREVRAQLERQSQAELRHEAKRFALEVVGRLQHAAREAREVASSRTLQPSHEADAMVDEVVVLSLDGVQVLGGDGAWEPLTPAQPKLLRSGEPVLLRRRGLSTHIWLGVTASDDGQTLIAGRVPIARLLDEVIELTLPQTSGALVADDRGQVIQGRNNGTVWPDIPADSSGLLEWENNGRWLGAYFKPPLVAQYGVQHWTIAVARRQDEVYAPVRGFLWQFSLLVVFTLGVVTLLSLVQVRQQLGPLHTLREGTRRLSAGDFTTPVTVNSGDEFQDLASSFDQMRAALRRTFDTLESISEIDRAVLSALDTSRIATTVVSSVAHVVPSSAVACIVIHDDATSSTTLWRAQHDGPVVTSTGGQIDAAGFADLREWTSRQRHEAPPALRALLHDDGSRVLAVPIQIDHRLAAVLVLVRTSALPFRPEDQDVVAQIARQVAVALTNARLVQRLERLNLGTLNALARTIDAKSPWTAGHSERVTEYGVALARALGLDEPTVAELRRGGLLHDIGKIAVPSGILDKPGALTPDEMAAVKRHPEVGARILEPIAEYASAIPIVLEHHERWDGGGYPFGLRGEQISLGGRIFALADVFDALTSDRPYRRGWPIDDVVALFWQETGRHFDPALAPIFIELIPHLISGESSRLSSVTPAALSA